MRCLHCGKRLSLLRKFSDGEFCSAEHRQLFQHQQNDLALARLIESQVRIERPKHKEPPKPHKQVKLSQEPAEQHVPEAPLLTEWFLPVRRRIVFVPVYHPISAEISLGCPVSGLVLEQYGFHRPGKLPLAWAAQPPNLCAVAAKVTPLYKNGPEIPGLGAPVRSADVPEMAEQVRLAAPLPAAAAPAGDSISLETLPCSAEPQAPRLVLQTQPPDPVEILPEEEIVPPEDILAGELPLCAVAGLIFSSQPVAHPAAAIAAVPVSAQFSTFEPQEKPVRAFQPLEECPTSDEESIAGALALRDVVALEFSRPVGPPPPAVHALPVTAEYSKLDEPVPPAQVVSAASLLLREDGSLQPVESAPPVGLAALCRALQPDSLTPTAAAAVPPLKMAGLPEPSMAQCTRSARLKPRAMAAAAGVSIHPVDAQPVHSEADPVPPQRLWTVNEPTLPQPPDLRPLAFFDILPPTAGLYGASPVPVDASDWAPLTPASAFRPEIAVFDPSALPEGDLDIAATPVRTVEFKLGAPEQFPPRFIEPEPPSADEPPMLKVQLRLLDGRAMTGPAALPRSSRRDDAGLWADTIATQPMMGSSRLTLDHADGSGPREVRRRESSRKGKSLLTFNPASLPGRRFWSHAPADLKWVALGLPLILAIVIYSFKGSAPKVDVGQQVAGVDKTVLGTQLNSLQRVILNRAAVKRFDDFRGGLGSWQGREGWSKTWKYGEASFLEPGQLALYSPTLGMSDYTVQFLGQIERRSLNWVFRAKDEQNYYAMRIVITKTGPLPEANVVRYAVIDGKEQSMKSLPIPFPVRSDTLYLVRMDVQGNRFTTYIQGGIVDSFEDDRLESGGVGFYSPKGDRSFLRWVEVTHQYDYLGRLCALLAPYNVQADGRKSE